MAFRDQARARSRSRSPLDKKRRDGHRGDEFSNNLINFDKYSYKTQVPSSIILLKGLAQHLSEPDIKTATLSVGCASKDVKLMRKKDKGSSKGIAIVEFYSVEDAQRLLMTQNGELMVKGQYRAIMQYFESSDWYCQCGVRNYKKRESCLKCGNNDICTHPTNIVMITCLPYDMTEAKLLEIVNTNCDLAIKCLRRTRDGNCFIEMNNITDAILLYNTLGSVTLKVGFYRHKNIPSAVSSAASSAVAAAQWNNTLADVPRLAEYSASLYAKTPDEKQKYLEYYTQYYAKQITEGKSVDISQETPDGLGTRIHPAPDVSSFQYDQTSGYYYDASTKLYYDANTQYFYNSKTNNYLYWDATNKTYYKVPTANESDTNKGKTEENQDSGKKSDDKDKVKVAKRVAKDMEKWAKTLNHRKEVSKVAVNIEQTDTTSQSTTGSADVCFSVVGNREETQRRSLVAAYDSDEEPEETVSGEEKLQIDWDKLACLICKRQFNSKDILTKHIHKSDLHKSNLSMWYTSRNLDPNDEAQRTAQYRDRAKERRLKYGEPEVPPELKLKTKYQKVKEASVTYEEPTKKGIGSDNVGNKLLQKMGWTQGQGLGKTNQGRTSIIEAEARISTAGLGTQAIGMQPAPGETYKDCVKKMMRARYQQME
ncbi:hypothetical protein WDU94_014232 [Cyamophila willieti]